MNCELRIMNCSSVAAAHFGEQVEDLDVEPDQRDHDAERCIPLHKFGRTVGDALLDEVEVEDEVERGDGDDNETEADADEAVAINGAEQGDVEEAEQQLGHVEDEDAAGGCDYTETKLLGDFDEAGFVGEEQHEERAKSESDGFHGDAGIALLEERRDAPEHEAFEERVDG